MNKKEIVSLIKKNKTPFYVYSKKGIINNCKFFMNIPYKNKSIAFATMANINRDFLGIIKKRGLTVFVNSLKHLKKTIDIGFNPKNIVFTSSGMNKKIMKEVYKKKCILNLDSVNQIEEWFKLFPNSRVGIRCNIGNLVNPKYTRAGYFIGKKSRLGLTLKEIKELKNKERINGIHMYPGTDIIDISYFKSCSYALTKLISFFPNLEYIDFGGGFGIEDKNGKKINKKEYSLMIIKLLKKVNKNPNKKIKLILEPGRIIGGDSAYFVTRVVDIKRRYNHQYIGVDASTAQFPRPLIYPKTAKHPLLFIPKRKKGYFKSSIFGCSTYSRDYFVEDKMLPEIKIGDLIVFGNSGSYCSSMFTEFLGFDKPEEIFI